jgi:hypothetical protein
MLTIEATAKRVVDAFAIDRRLPRVRSPKAPGNAHPAVFRSEAERLVVALARKADRIEDDEPIIPPTKAELTTMDETFSWLRQLAVVDLDTHDALRAWAKRKAGCGRSIRAIAKDMGTSAMTLLRRKDRALALLVSLRFSLLSEGLT